MQKAEKNNEAILRYKANVYFGPKFDPFTPILGKQEFSRKIWLWQFLAIIDA